MFRVCGDGVERFNKNTGEWSFLVGCRTSRGYQKTTISVSGVKRWRLVHRIVWETHRGPIPEGMEIDHINGDKADNRISNLRVVTHGDNLRYAAVAGKCGRPTRLRPHQLKLLCLLPRGANFSFWADRWGVYKPTLMNFRCQHKRKYVDTPLAYS